MPKAVLLALAAVTIDLFIFGLARASPPDKVDPALAPWFKSLRNPALGYSCCADADGHILRDEDWRIAGNSYQVLINGGWQDVPPEAVIQRADNPTGGAVVFYPPGIDHPPIYCFLRPSEA